MKSGLYGSLIFRNKWLSKEKKIFFKAFTIYGWLNIISKLQISVYYKILQTENLKLFSYVESISSVKSFSGSGIFRLKFWPLFRT